MMRLVSTAWVQGTFEQFSKSLCLDTHHKIGYLESPTGFEIFILEGFDKIPVDVVSLYSDSRIYLKDATCVFQEVKQSTSNISGYGLNSYEINCFLRWLVLRIILVGEPFLHIDTDIFFNVPLSEALTLFYDKTGTFGSPCFTCVSDHAWLDLYENYLLEMIADRDSLQRRLGHEKNSFRAEIGSDQDLISLLNRKGLLPSLDFADFADSYAVFTNPLWPYDAKVTTPMLLSRDGEVDSLNKRRVLFWHLQNNFSDYVSRFALLNSYKDDWPGAFLPVRLELPFLQLRPSAENFAFYALQEASRRMSQFVSLDVVKIDDMGPLRYFNRAWVADYFVYHGCGRELFSADYWWEPGIFANC